MKIKKKKKKKNLSRVVSSGSDPILFSITDKSKINLKICSQWIKMHYISRESSPPLSQGINMLKSRSDLNFAGSTTSLFLFCFFLSVDGTLQRQTRASLWKEETSSDYEILVHLLVEA